MGMRSINLLFLFRKRRNCLRGGRSITVPIYREDDKTDRSNDRGISLLPTTYKSLPNILLSGLNPYAE